LPHSHSTHKTGGDKRGNPKKTGRGVCTNTEQARGKKAIGRGNIAERKKSVLEGGKISPIKVKIVKKRKDISLNSSRRGVMQARVGEL